jgi:hypothetical protein
VSTSQAFESEIKGKERVNNKTIAVLNAQLVKTQDQVCTLLLGDVNRRLALRGHMTQFPLNKVWP